MGRGRPGFPPDVACPAVLTIWAHRGTPPVAYGTLTPCGDPFQRSSAQGWSGLRGGCRPLRSTRSTPSWHRRQAIAPAGFGLLPVRSPLLRESSLFLGVLRCFSSPGALLSYLRCPAVRRAGCPIRTSPDRRLPAPPRGISPRGRVLPRPPTPRHPPCAHHADILHSFPSGMRRDHDRRPARASGMVPPGRTARRAATTPAGSSVVLVCVVCVLCMVLSQCARASRHEPPRPTGLGATSGSDHGLPWKEQPSSRGRRTQRVPRGALSRCNKTRRSSDPKVGEVVKPRAKPSPDLARDFPTCWRSGHRPPGGLVTAALAHTLAEGRVTPANASPPVEPRGLEPRTSAVQGRRSPS